jgi:hypothetical protein
LEPIHTSSPTTIPLLVWGCRNTDADGGAESDPAADHRERVDRRVGPGLDIAGHVRLSADVDAVAQNEPRAVDPGRRRDVHLIAEGHSTGAGQPVLQLLLIGPLRVGGLVPELPRQEAEALVGLV